MRPKCLMDEGVNDVFDERGGASGLDAVSGHITHEEAILPP